MSPQVVSLNEQDYIQLTLSAEDSPVSPSPWLESKKVKGTTVTCGRKCSGLSENLSRAGYLVRTYLESCALPQTTFVRTWSVKATVSGYSIMKLRLSEHRTGGNESSLWATPNAADCQGSHGGRQGRNLRTDVWKWKKGLLPTPCATEARQGLQIRRDGKKGSQQSLSTVVKFLPTPTAHNATGSSNTATRQGSPDLQTLVNGQLNPSWVEWLMGFPPGWTEL